MAYTPTTWRDGDTITAARLNKLEQGVADQEPGPKGDPGGDGFSPVVSVANITGGHRVTITDAAGAHIFDVMDGTSGTGGSGTPGKDGVSPVVTVTNITGGHRVSITDANGTQTFDVLDGTPGAPGAPGEPGKDATINGRNAVEIVAGANVTISQQGDTLTISAAGGTSSSGDGASVGGGSVPKGTIVIWSGSTSDIPDGWQLCDGTNGTPDLRDRFVLGAGGARAPGATGGEETATLTVDQIPAHSHYLPTAMSSGGYTDRISNGGSLGSVSTTNTATVESGGGQAHNNMPPFYALCYIMAMVEGASSGTGTGTGTGGTTVAGVSSFNGRTGAVRPATGDYTAALVGARPDTWTPTASEVGAVPTTRTVNGKALSGNISLTAADVSARSSSWMPTAAEVGAVPTGAVTAIQAVTQAEYDALTTKNASTLYLIKE